MGTVQVTNLSGKILEAASWKVEDMSNVSVGEIVRINLRVEDERLAKYLSKATAQECTIEREDEGHSVTLGFVVERFTHLLDDSTKELESMAWLKPMNRTVEATIAFIMDRDSCDQKFLAAVGVKRREEED